MQPYGAEKFPDSKRYNVLNKITAHRMKNDLYQYIC